MSSFPLYHRYMYHLHEKNINMNILFSCTYCILTKIKENSADSYYNVVFLESIQKGLNLYYI